MFPSTRVTRVLSKDLSYEEERFQVAPYITKNQPTMFTPWNKGIVSPEIIQEWRNDKRLFMRESFSEAAFRKELPNNQHYQYYHALAMDPLSAVRSLVFQLIYDIFSTVGYTIIAIPSLILGAGLLYYSTYVEKNEDEKAIQSDMATTCFINPLLVIYFALASVVDCLREFCALFTRTYATIMQTPEEKACPWVERPSICQMSV